MTIHKTALVHPDAILGNDVRVGPHTIIGPKVQIGAGSHIGANIVIEGSVEIGEKCNIYTGAIIGNPPQDLKYNGEDTKVVVGNNCTIREYVTVNRGTSLAGETRIGDNCLLMAYVHIAHDCVVGNGVVLANNATLAGHVEIDDSAIVGGLTAIHQFVKIGTLTILGGASRVSKDVPPYCKAAGNPLRMYGLNSIGLQRNNFSAELRLELKRVYKIIFRSKYNTTQALEALAKFETKYDEVNAFISFVKESERGICKE